MQLPSVARDIFSHILSALDIDAAMRARVRSERDALIVGDQSYAMSEFSRTIVIAIGKAAASMWDAVVPTLQATLRQRQRLEGIVVSPAPPSTFAQHALCFAGGHPLPAKASLDAAEAILTMLHTCDERCFVLFLISGGSSAMVEQALDPALSLDDLVGFYRTLIGSGLSIAEMNALRKHVSAVKGGRLAVAAARATQCTLLLSDVPADALHIIGSGPSLPDPSTIADCRALLERNAETLHLPRKLQAFFQSPALPETPKPSDTAFSRSNVLSLLSSEDLAAAAAQRAHALGFHVVVDNRCDEWDVHDAAAYLLGELRRLRETHPRVCLISVGEVAVTLPAQHGAGGRNQHFALECARLLHAQNFAATILSAGSDGIDGNSPAAGAVADQTTFTRAAAEHDPLLALAQYNSFPLFEALDDAVLTGPTGMNVRDLRLLLSE
jgi:glycerate 2-kinase